ncbi:hypothetical protein W97_05596 [Coniosporium apollinis CBS 100218]|uniref:F-box domain-containing protein n=1 Tax=Coniosporium apollinis (strain CBS 100218) TaxID=1168221 RepID=R7YWI8_CONA1|nr:uncharacterized protein W97_05596 [Coniosporium apollinis CBS 100218]EON66203.1 hypothetical protein W97_05596 [Coniosporium apollinis CBS 100218]
MVTHRCQLPTPDIFEELPRISFKNETLSQDVRTMKLLQLAINNLVNVRTLRIIQGHWNLTRGLLYGFFHRHRISTTPVRRLWLENCSIEGMELDFQDQLRTEGLESVRFRRMHIAQHPRRRKEVYALARGGDMTRLDDSRSGFYQTTIRFEKVFDSTEGEPGIPSGALAFDDEAHRACKSRDVLGGQSCREHPLLPEFTMDPIGLMSGMLLNASGTLTSLNLDWVLVCDTPIDDSSELEPDGGMTLRYRILHMLADLRFPNLRSFQLRNAVMVETAPAWGHYLLDTEPLLSFIEAHSTLQCLAWPINRFFSHQKPSESIAQRARNVIDSLSSNLLELRVDSDYFRHGEPLTDVAGDQPAVAKRTRRRRFISEFAAQMTNVQRLKLEGGIPRDEKRETIRAMHRCPLSKIVMIGVSCPYGNVNPPTHWQPVEGNEHESAIRAFASAKLITPEAGWKFTPEYGWEYGPPMLYHVATHFAQTIRELRLCGYDGAPVLYDPKPLQNPLLENLRHFVNLERLVLSFDLDTWFDNEWRDEEIVAYWLDARDSSRKALAVVPSEDQEEGSWTKLLRERFAPQALANQVAEQLGLLLPEPAKKRGMKIRASFSLGDESVDIWDLDIRVQMDAVGEKLLVKELVGPREEGEKERREAKLENRSWF